MRHVAILILLLSLPLITQGQNTSIECDTGERYTSQVTLLPPEIAPDEFTQYIVSVLGVDTFNPVMMIAAPDYPAICGTASEQTTLYEMTLPVTGEIPVSFNNVQDFVLLPGQSTVQIGEESDSPGEFVILVEGTFDSLSTDSHTFTLPLTNELLNSGVTPTAYLFALVPDFEPSLTITVPEGESVEAIPLEETIRLQTILGTAETALTATLPETVGNVQLTVASNGAEGIYALAIHLKTGEATRGDGTAEVTTHENGALTLSCDGAVVSENAMRVELPDDGETYNVTAVGLTAFNPIMAVVNERGTGVCYDDTEAALTYAAALPGVNVNASIFSSQAVVDGDARSVVVGSLESSSGEFIIMIEGGSVETGDSGDSFGAYITPAMISVSPLITAYAIAVDDTLNPMLAYLDNAGEVVTNDEDVAYQCDDAGIPDNCYGQTPSLRDSFVTLRDSVNIAAFEVDAMLELPINETLTGATFPLRVTGSQDTSGAYIVILHIITQ
jgi:hypothetical protein